MPEIFRESHKFVDENVINSDICGLESHATSTTTPTMRNTQATAATNPPLVLDGFPQFRAISDTWRAQIADAKSSIDKFITPISLKRKIQRKDAGAASGTMINTDKSKNLDFKDCSAHISSFDEISLKRIECPGRLILFNLSLRAWVRRDGTHKTYSLFGECLRAFLRSGILIVRSNEIR